MSKELAEQIFKPGNLVFGGTFSPDVELRRFLIEGIKPGVALRISRGLTPHAICMCLL